ncbi:MAG: hypothetical protein MUC49_14840 [Raineya sp.]|jgi:hypothetical protein|nr:hypothetical protein [Raineya sp.]
MFLKTQSLGRINVNNIEQLEQNGEGSIKAIHFVSGKVKPLSEEQAEELEKEVRIYEMHQNIQALGKLTTGTAELAELLKQGFQQETKIADKVDLTVPTTDPADLTVTETKEEKLPVATDGKITAKGKKATK